MSNNSPLPSKIRRSHPHQCRCVRNSPSATKFPLPPPLCTQWTQANRRNVGIEYVVGPALFRSIIGPHAFLDREVLAAYLGLLQNQPEVIDVPVHSDLKSKIIILPCSFNETCKDIWNKKHANDPSNSRYIEEVCEQFAPKDLQ